jgi:hypothetical protein
VGSGHGRLDRVGEDDPRSRVRLPGGRWPLDGPNTNYFVFDGYETDELYDRLDAGELGAGNPFAYVAMASRKDPEQRAAVPEGHTNLQIMTLAPRGYAWWGVDDVTHPWRLLPPQRGLPRPQGRSHRRG